MILQKNRIFLLGAILIITITSNINPQDVDIIPYLKLIESGNVIAVRNELIDLKQKYPESPSVMFLDGVLTENGQDAVVIYQQIVDKYPDSKYADAALYRIYSYYYALGLYESADKKLVQLKSEYPNSPYIKIAEQNKLPSNPEIANEESETTVSNEVGSEINSDKDDYKFTIQAGAFSKLENAQVLLDEFENSGIFSEIKQKSVAGTTFHVVYVGKFLNENDADDFLKTINKKFDLTGRVVEIPK